jgi:hypothetical protein
MRVSTYLSIYVSICRFKASTTTQCAVLCAKDKPTRDRGSGGDVQYSGICPEIQ